MWIYNYMEETMVLIFLNRSPLICDLLGGASVNFNFKKLMVVFFFIITYLSMAYILGN
jgi:hypothetical protein